MRLGGLIASMLTDWRYTSIAIIITMIVGFTLSYFLQLIFLYPRFVVYVPPSAYLDLVYVLLVSMLSGGTLTLSVYRASQNKLGKIGFGGTGLAIFSGICSCTALVLLSLSSSVLGTFVAFLVLYETPVRIVSLSLFILSLYFIGKDGSPSSHYNYQNSSNKR